MKSELHSNTAKLDNEMMTYSSTKVIRKQNLKIQKSSNAFEILLVLFNLHIFFLLDHRSF